MLPVVFPELCLGVGGELAPGAPVDGADDVLGLDVTPAVRLVPEVGGARGAHPDPVDLGHVEGQLFGRRQHFRVLPTRGFRDSSGLELG